MPTLYARSNSHRGYTPLNAQRHRRANPPKHVKRLAKPPLTSCPSKRKSANVGILMRDIIPTGANSSIMHLFVTPNLTRNTRNLCDQSTAHRQKAVSSSVLAGAIATQAATSQKRSATTAYLLYQPSGNLVTQPQLPDFP